MRRGMTVLAFATILAACRTNVTQVVAQPDTGKTIFFDSFDSVKASWQQSGGSWHLTNGWLVQRTDDPRQLNAIKFIETPRIGDATIETEVRVLPNRPQTWTDSDQDRELMRSIRNIIGAGIVFRMQDKDNYYMFRLAGEEGAVLGKMVGGNWVDIKNPRVRDFLLGERIGFRRDNVYRIKVECYGSNIKCYVNDEPIITVTDGEYGNGQFGLVTFKTGAEFDFIKVTR